MIHFTSYLFGPWFKKEWFWFADPQDVKGAAWVLYFSYHDVEVPGFSKKEGWTSIIDLTPSLEELWSHIREKYTRFPIEEGRKKGITIRQDTNIEEFRKIYKTFRAAKNLPEDDSTLFDRGILFSAYYEGRMMAGHVFIDDGTHLRSWVTASRRFEELQGKDKRLIGSANRMLVWSAIEYAKNNNYTLIDLGGINPDPKNGGEQSLAEFKESFGGRRIKNYYYVKVYSRPLKLLGKIKQLLS